MARRGINDAEQRYKGQNGLSYIERETTIKHSGSIGIGKDSVDFEIEEDLEDTIIIDRGYFDWLEETMNENMRQLRKLRDEAMLLNEDEHPFSRVLIEHIENNI